MKRNHNAADGLARAVSAVINSAARFFIVLGFYFFGFSFTRTTICEKPV
ncbi:MAG: hypothetical protein IJ646_05090 [Clostridia bacterium]|nr:hypothetical protein [Clostridia bacterium]